MGYNTNILSEGDFENYKNAKQLIYTNQGENAIMSLEVLDKQYPENVFILKSFGLAYASSGNALLASSYFQKCLQLNPTFQLDTVFMLNYGKVLYYKGDFRLAKVVLKQSLKTKEFDHYKVEINNLLTKLQ
jgi:tetratricopeptide (TPR) repeat protein